MSGTTKQYAYLPSSPIVVDAPNGDVRVEWRHFFHQLWNRTGGSTAGAGVGGADAPSDGHLYGRMNVTWVQALPLSGGSMLGTLTLQADPTAPLQAATKQYTDNINAILWG